MEDQPTDPNVFAPPTPRHPAVEVRHYWGDTLVAVRHARRGEPALSIGAETAPSWRIFGVDLAFVPRAVRPLLAPLALLGSETDDAPVGSFLLPDDACEPRGAHALYTWEADRPSPQRPEGWAVRAMAVPSPAALATFARGAHRLELRLMDAPARNREEERADYAFGAVLSGAGVLAGLFAALVALAPPPAETTLVEIEDRIMKVVMLPAVVEPPKQASQTPAPNGGKKAGGPEGKAGREESRLAKASGREARDRAALDRKIVSEAGILGVLSDSGALAGLNNAQLDAGLTDALGGLSGPKGVQLGNRGLGERGFSPGGGGIEGTGLGTLGDGPGAGPAGPGGPGGHGDLGPKQEGHVVSGGEESVVLGCMDRGVVDEVVRRHLAPIRYCYQRRLQQSPNLSGKVVTRFVIAQDGTVSSAAPKSSTLGDEAAEACIAGRFAKMEFPPLPAGCKTVVVSYPFLFSPE